MEITPQQKKILTIAAISVVAVVALLFLARFFSSYLSTRVVPSLSESIVGGRLLGSKITPGEHKLELRAKTINGRIITDSVVFTAETDPYSNNGSDPYASPTPTPTPTQDPYSS